MDDDQRTMVPNAGAERPMLEAMLDFHRDTLMWKCSGLTDEQLKTAAAPPSTMSLLGLVRHLTDVERSWFRAFKAGPQPRVYWRTGPDGRLDDSDFDEVASADVTADISAYLAEVDTCRQAVAGFDLDDLDDERPRRSPPPSLRWIYLHMIEEYARHNGHADLLRERIDGRTGE